MNDNKMTLAGKLTAGFAVPIIAIILISVLVYNSLNSLVESNGWVSHTHRVIGEGNRILASMVDMETGMRGFLVAGREEFLEPYHGGKKVFEETISQLKMTVSDNPAQVARLVEIEKLKADWLRNAAEPQIAKRREVNESNEAINEFKRISARTVGKQMFDGFRESVAILKRAYERTSDKDGMILVENLLLAMVDQETGQRGFLLSGQEASLEPYKKGRQNFNEAASKLRSYVNSSTLRQALEDAVTKAEGWRAQAAEPEIEARRAMNRVPATLDDVIGIIEKGAGKKSMDAIRVQISAFVAEEEKLVEIRTADAEALSSSTTFLTIVGTLIAIIVASIIGFIVIRGIRAQIGAEPEVMAGISRRVSEGDLTVHVDSTGKEVGVYAAMGAMVNNLKNIVEQVVSAANFINTAAGEVADGNTSLSQRTEEQASSLEETASSMEEMTGTVKQNAESATQARQLAEENRERASNGAEVVSKTVRAMDEINESSTRIADIIGTIDGIAFQTNLLALNAAVEAARAGDHGRGFAVVASEVRTLAQRSADAAKEIKTLIEDSVSKVQVGTELVSDSGKTLQEIIEGTQEVADIVAEIAAASQEQAAGIEQVNNAIMQMDNMTQENAALVEEASAASRTMQDQSHQLIELMEFFQLGMSNMKGATGQKKVAQRKTATPNRRLESAPARQAKPSTITNAAKPVAQSNKSASEDWQEF